jgi:uncharacterized protein UPF0093
VVYLSQSLLRAFRSRRLNGWLIRLIKAYSWFKSLHIVSVVAWMAGLLSLLVRIFATFFSQFASVSACRDLWLSPMQWAGGAKCRSQSVSVW